MIAILFGEMGKLLIFCTILVLGFGPNTVAENSCCDEPRPVQKASESAIEAIKAAASCDLPEDLTRPQAIGRQTVMRPDRRKGEKMVPKKDPNLSCLVQPNFMISCPDKGIRMLDKCEEDGDCARYAYATDHMKLFLLSLGQLWKQLYSGSLGVGEISKSGGGDVREEIVRSGSHLNGLDVDIDISGMKGEKLWGLIKAMYTLPVGALFRGNQAVNLVVLHVDKIAQMRAAIKTEEDQKIFNSIRFDPRPRRIDPRTGKVIDDHITHVHIRLNCPAGLAGEFCVDRDANDSDIIEAAEQCPGDYEKRYQKD